MKFSEFFEEDEKQMKNQAYDTYRVNEILKGNENMQETKQILEYAYQSQRGNPLLVITFYALKKIEEKDFMKELEKTYGIYMGVDEFVKVLKEKLKEINSFKSLHEYVGVELEQEKTELDVVVEAYERAKEKKYIRDPYEKIRTQAYNHNHVNYRGNRGGRGRGRGGRRGYGGYQNGYGRDQYW